VVVTDTICCKDKVGRCPRLRQLPVSNILAEAIRRIHSDESVSSLFV
jgi:ribose-phosphate pyrophosphokinase